MAEFVFGRQAEKKCGYLLNKMKASLSAGKKAVLIVPEQQALFWDTLIAEKLSPAECFNVETVSFTRLCDNVFRLFGGVCEKYITESEKTLLMWNAVVSCADRLKFFRTLDREDRYAPLFLRTVNELKLYSVTPADLLEASARLFSDDPSLSQKLSDLALIYSVYDEMLHISFADPAEMPDYLCDTLIDNDYFGDRSVFLDSFYTLTPKQMKVMGEIFRQTDDVTVTFSIAREDHDSFDCSFIKEYVNSMLALAKKFGRNVKITESGHSMAPEFLYISENLWNYSAAPFESGTDRITVVKCTDRYDEATLAAAKIKYLINAGASYSDIAVVAADMDALAGITDTELIRHGIPVYVSGKTPLTREPAFKLIINAVNAAAAWKRESIVAMMKSGLCSLTPDECDAFEKYTEIWNINGKKMFLSDEWQMNPDGYSETISKWGNELIFLANKAKDTVIPPLSAFAESFTSNVKNVCRAVLHLLSDFNVYEKLCENVKTLESAGDYSAAQEKSRVWTALMTLLDTVASTLPDAKTDPLRFSSLLNKVADTLGIGTIPDGLDRVMMGSVKNVRLDGIHHLIVLGATSGEFPAVPANDGFFTDRDKILLEGVGVILSPTADKRLGEELFRFRYALSSPKDSLTVIIPSGEGSRPSVGATALIHSFPKAAYYDFTLPGGNDLIREFAGTGSEKSSVPLSADGESINKAFAENIFGKCITMTHSRLEKYTDCPFCYYCTYVLHLDEGKTAEIVPSDVGTFIHAVLENFMKEAAEENVFPVSDDVIEGKCDRLIREYIARVCPPTESSRRDVLFRRLSKSIRLYTKALSEEFAQSRFRPFAFELPVGFDNSEYPVPTKPIPLSDGAVMRLRGDVDRVDILREDGKVYLRVVDYKTNSKKFSVSNVMAGKNVQLLLYLFSLCNMPENCGFYKKAAPNKEKIIPAGAIYFAAVPGNISSDSVISEDEARSMALLNIERKGIVLDDMDIIDAMDSGITGTYVPASVKKDGTLTAKSSVATIEFFKEIEKAMEESIAGIGNRLISGDTRSAPDVSPGHDACKWCSLMPVCRHRCTEKSAETEEKTDE